MIRFRLEVSIDSYGLRDNKVLAEGALYDDLHLVGMILMVVSCDSLGSASVERYLYWVFMVPSRQCKRTVS